MAGVDPVHWPMPLRSVVRYMMGGVDANINGATVLPGLFAAGECACLSLNGSNRLGSNSLTELLVFGRRTARAAAQFALDHQRVASEAVKLEAQSGQQRLDPNVISNDRR